MHDVAYVRDQETSAGITYLYRSTPKLGDRFLAWLGWVLTGYALAGRGFAYLGVPPLYIGEITALFGLLALMSSSRVGATLRFTPVKILGALALWGMICTVPYIPVYGVDALRDTVIWSYGAFSIIVAGLLMQDPVRLRFLLLRYRRFAVLFISASGFIYLLAKLARESIPTLPGSGVPMISMKEGDMMVHAAGVTAFMIVGMMRTRLFLLLMLGLICVVVGAASRGGMLSLVLALSLIVLLRPPGAGPKLRRLLGGLCIGVILLIVVNPKITLKGGREVSAEQLWANVNSIVGEEEDEGLEGTKEWRLMWWGKIIDYTVYGPHFWTGKGFGISLGLSDGFGNLSREHLLRSPHNGHITMLARAGVPGFILWMLLHTSWFLLMLRAYFAARRVKDRAWSGVFVFLLAYWTAFMVNTTFDVFLEGPMGGIWFWTIIGVGLAACYIYRYAPHVLWDEGEVGDDIFVRREGGGQERAPT